MMSEIEKGSVSIAFVRGALRSVICRGLDPAPFLVQASIPPALIHSDAARVTPASFGTLWLTIAAALDDEFFGLDSRRMKVGSFTTLCHLTLGAPNLHQALQRARGFFNIILDDTAIAVIENEREASLRLITKPSTENPDPGKAVFAHETLLVMLHGLLCWLIGRRIPIRSAQFAYPKPAWWMEYGPIFCSDLSFGASETRITFGAGYLKLPIVQTQRSASVFLHGAPANFLLKYKNEQSLAARVRRRLRADPPESWPSLEELAEDLKLGASTLHRKLDQEGTSFSSIKDMVRRDLAIRYLAHSAMSINEIGYIVGFAEPSAFRRAFKQWTGLRPSDYRPAA
jgi:AraC-like DNA-binding protein